MRQFNVGDLVRYRHGSLDRRGIVVRDCEDGDYVVAFVTGQKGLHPNHNKSKCRWRCLELIK